MNIHTWDKWISSRERQEREIRIHGNSERERDRKSHRRIERYRDRESKNGWR